MSATVTMVGLTEFQAALRQLPAGLTGQANAIVDLAAAQANREIVANYPLGPTGNLKRRVRTTHNIAHQFGTQAIVKSSAPHASIFEYGTKVRATKRGANRGAMPKAPPNEAMIPVVIRVRRRMLRDIMALVQSAGFDVSP